MNDDEQIEDEGGPLHPDDYSPAQLRKIARAEEWERRQEYMEHMDWQDCRPIRGEP